MSDKLETTTDDLEAAASTALAIFRARFPELDMDEDMFKLGFADGCNYMLSFLKERL